MKNKTTRGAGLSGKSQPEAAQKRQSSQSGHRLPGARALSQQPVGSHLPALQMMADQSGDARGLASLQAMANQHAGNAPIQRAPRNPSTFSDMTLVNHTIGNLHGQPAHVKADALLNSTLLPDYGAGAQNDEQVEIVGAASYLNKVNTPWQAALSNLPQANHEFQRRQQRVRGVRDTLPTHPLVKFDRLANRASPGKRDVAPWFMNGDVWAITGDERQAQLNTHAQGLTDNVRNAQSFSGHTYGRDVEIVRNKFEEQQTGRTIPPLNYGEGDILIGGVLIFRCQGRQLVLMPSIKQTDGMGVVSFTAEVLRTQNNANGPQPFPQFPAGTIVTVSNDQGVVTVNGTGTNNAVFQLPAARAGLVYTAERYFAWEAINKGIGLGEIDDEEMERSRGRADEPETKNNALFDDLMQDIDPGPQGNADQSLTNTLGPRRNRVNVQDLGWNVGVAPHRRLGGDTIFAEADHPAPAAYDPSINPADQVDVSDPDWYYNQQNRMQGRFVGGRSNSTLGYLETATSFYLAGQMTLAECKDVMAFVIADMVVSGEHSLPECMTSVVMAAGSSRPWSQTPLRITTPAYAMQIWFKFLQTAMRTSMKTDARTKLEEQLQNTPPDILLLKTLTMLINELSASGA